MFLKHLIEKNISKIFLNDGYENQLLINVSKTFSEQTFIKHCQQMLFKHFVYTVYQTFHDECLKNISSKTSFLQLFYECLKPFQSNLDS